MKFMGIQRNLMIIMLLLCFGCATAPTPPDLTQLMLDSVDRVRTGRAGTGPTADQLNQQFADYDKARQEYESSTSYKLKILAVVPLLVLGAAASDIPCYRYGYYGGWRGYGYQGCGNYGYRPGKTIVTTNPIGGGAYQSVIKHYK